MPFVPEWINRILVLAIVLASGFLGWQLRAGQAERDMNDVLVAQQKAVASAIAAKATAEDRLAVQSQAYEDIRAAIDARAVSTRTTIREIYRDRPTPNPDCAAPVAARELLIRSGANNTADGFDATHTDKPSATLPTP